MVSVTAAGDLGTPASFTLEANEEGVTYECLLTTNSVAGLWEVCTSPKTYTDLLPGDYAFSVRGTDEAGNVSAVVTKSWTVEPPADTTAPVVTVTAVGVLGLDRQLRLHRGRGRRDVRVPTHQGGQGGQDWKACTSPKEYSLAAGAYVFSARGKDAAGNVSTLSAPGLDGA